MVLASVEASILTRVNGSHLVVTVPGIATSDSTNGFNLVHSHRSVTVPGRATDSSVWRMARLICRSASLATSSRQTSLQVQQLAHRNGACQC